MIKVKAMSENMSEEELRKSLKEFIKGIQAQLSQVFNGLQNALDKMSKEELRKLRKQLFTKTT